METYWLCFRLLSDATFGRGEGLAGVVDQEVDHDPHGLPVLRGRALKGLLNEECANLLYALGQSDGDGSRWARAAQRLFGGPGSTQADDAVLRIGPARLPTELRAAVRQALDVPDSPLRPADVLESLTTIRRQTAVEESGVPAEGSLRAIRAVVRNTPFEAQMAFLDGPTADDLALLAACALAFRRAGTGRNRGRGRLLAALHEDDGGHPGRDVTREKFELFAQEVQR